MEEIEKKYLVKELPQDLTQYKKIEIIQGYLNSESEPILRIRKYGDNYFLTYKFSNKKQKSKECNVCTEYELPIEEKAFNHLKNKIDGKIIQKTRYYIPYENHNIELDIFNDWLKGLIVAEVEFENELQAKDFKKPDWLGKEVTKDKKYRNSYLSSGKVDIKELIN